MKLLAPFTTICKCTIEGEVAYIWKRLVFMVYFFVQIQDFRCKAE